VGRTIIFAFVSAPAFIIAAVIGIVWMLPTRVVKVGESPDIPPLIK
jgi:hypothetical protein